MEVSSLQKSCIQQIARDMEFWCPKTTENLSDYLYVLGPFVHLGSRQIQELINILNKRKKLKTSYLYSLIHCGLTFLDLSSCKNLVSDSLVQIISKRCRNLHHLSLAYCSRISARYLQDLPKNLPNLRSLDLSGCFSCDDDVLFNLDEHCKYLQVLKLESCRKVTDFGLAAMNDHLNLVEIDLSATSVSPEGVFALLQNHRDLQSLSLCLCESIVLAESMEYFDDIFLSLGETKLKYLNLSHSTANDKSIEIVSQICPNISSLMIDGIACTRSLVHLKRLDHLTHLEMDGMNLFTGPESSKFHKFLNCRGSQLEKLFIQKACDINTAMVASYCPKLTSFSLAGSEMVIIDDYTLRDNQLVTLLEACPQLKVLNFQHCTFGREDPSTIFCTSESNLEELYLRAVNIRFEGLLQHLETPCFSNLRIIDISSNEHVHKDLLIKLVQCCKKLEQVNVRDCWNIKQCDVDEVNKLIVQLDRETEIIWS